MKRRIITYSLILLMVLTVTLTPVVGLTGVVHATSKTTNDDGTGVTYTGSWTDNNSATGYYNTDQHYASYAANTYVTFTFTGTGVSWIGAKTSDAGKAEVFLDDASQGIIDTYAASQALQQTLFTISSLDQKEHTLKIVIQSDKNASSSGTKISIDAFQWNDGGILHCALTGTGSCTEVDVNHLLITNSTSDPNHNYPRFLLDVNHTIYARMTSVSISWTTGVFSGYGYVDFRFDTKGEYSGQGYPSGADVVSINCGNFAPSSSGSCSPSPIYTQEEVTAGYSTSAVAVWNSNGQPQFYPTIIYSLELSTTAFESCADNYITLNSATFTIDPTVEFPTAAPQVYPTVADHDYRIDISGGPWNDGTNNRYDAAISWDGTTWTPLGSGSAAECISANPNNPNGGFSVVVKAASTSFHIRVNDSAGAFANNTGSLSYTISAVAQVGATDCSAQFSFDPESDWVASVTVSATSSSVTGSSTLTPGEWYVIEIASGSWMDGGVAPSRYDAQYTWGNVNGGGVDGAVWELIGDSGGQSGYCATTSGNYKTVYVQANNSSSVYFRVNDENQDFSTNTGQLGINIYHSGFTRTPSMCELQYGTDNLIGHSVLQATQENGVTIGIVTSSTSSQFGSYMLTPGAWYMLETTDGPWGWVGDTHTSRSYEAAISWGGSWVPLSEWSQAGCISQTDSLGHIRVYFQTPSTVGAQYTLRVNDTSTWFNNVGSLGVNLYKAFDQGNPPGDNGTCDFMYDDSQQPVGSGYIDATHEQGDYLTTLSANTLYAIEILGNLSSWQENASADPQYDLELSDDNGNTWHDVPNSYGGVLCYYQIGNKTIMFLQTGANYLYKMRVNSTSFADNVGGMQIKIYPANPGNTINPWSTNCLSAFGSTEQLSLYPLNSFEWLDVTRADGERIMTSVNWSQDSSIIGFAVELTNGPWHKNDESSPDDHYDAALSKDAGLTWYPINRDNPDIVCAQVDQLNRYWKGFFKAEANDVWKIRVNDDDMSDWMDNSGNLAYKLYAITSQTAPDCVIETNNPDCIDWSQIPGGIAINGQDACTTAIIMPDSLADIGGWMQYGVGIMMQYMAWCPQHTSALLALLNALKDKEPYASLIEFQQVITNTQNQLESYNWNDSSAPASIIENPGGVVDQVMNKVFPMDSGGPWSGGPVVDFNAGYSPGAFYSSCTGNLGDFLGPLLTQPVCFASDEMRETGASFWIQLLLDIGAVFWGIGAIKGEILRLAHFMVGVTYIGPEMSKPNITIDARDLGNPSVRIGRR